MAGVSERYLYHMLGVVTIAWVVKRIIPIREAGRWQIRPAAYHPIVERTRRGPPKAEALVRFRVG